MARSRPHLGVPRQAVTARRPTRRRLVESTTSRKTKIQMLVEAVNLPRQAKSTTNVLPPTETKPVWQASPPIDSSQSLPSSAPLPQCALRSEGAAGSATHKGVERWKREVTREVW